MSTSAWLSLFSICVLGTLSPGPSLVAVVNSTVQGSRLHGITTAICHACGIGLYAFLVALGMAVVIAKAPWLLKGVTYAGG